MWISKKKWDALNERVKQLEKDTSVVVGTTSSICYEYMLGLSFPITTEKRKPIKDVLLALLDRSRLTYELEDKKPAIPEKLKLKAVRSK